MSKISRLSSTDVANIATLPWEKKKKELERIEVPRVNWGYEPVTSALPKLLLAEPSLPFEQLPAGDDEKLIQQIIRRCKHHTDQRTANAAVARAIVEWRNANRVRGIKVQPEPLRTSTDTLRYCADVAVILNEALCVFHLDCRSSMGLTVNGKEFMKALSHHTALIGDLRAAEVGILRTPKSGPEARKAIFEPLRGDPSFTMEQVEEMILETYRVWELILKSRQSGERKSGTSDRDLFS